METKGKETTNSHSTIRSIITVLLIESVIVGISWWIGWPSIDGIVLFVIGLGALLLSYVVDTMLFGGNYVYQGRGSGYKWKGEYARYTIEEGGEPGSDLEKAKRAPAILNYLMIAGVIAIILSFILPRFFEIRH